MNESERDAAAKPTDFDIAIERLTAWVRDYGDSKPKVFIGDVSMLLLAAREARSERAARLAKEREDAKPVTFDLLLESGWWYQKGDHVEFNLSPSGFWKIVVDLEEPPDLSIQHKGHWLAIVKENATMGDVRRLLEALGAKQSPAGE